MNRQQPGAPMPDSLRALFRSRQHPARTVLCPHCGAAENQPCRSQSRTRRMPEVHPRRVSAWAQATTSCPHCRAGRGVECNDSHRPQSYVHPAREAEALEVAA